MSIRDKIEAFGLDRAENFVFLAWAMALFLTTVGFWVGRPVCALPVYLGFGCAFLLASILSWRMAVKCAGLCVACLALCAYTFSYYGVDASVCHVPMQRLLNEGWNPVLDGTIEALTRLTGGDISLYHTLCMPKTVQLTGALIAKGTGLYVADTWVHYFMLYVVFSSGVRFAHNLWNCGRIPAVIFAVFAAMPSQVGTMMGSMIDYVLYACMATTLFSAVSWGRTRQAGDLFLLVVNLALMITIKPMGFFWGLAGLVIIAASHWRHAKTSSLMFVAAIFVLVTASQPYITTWVRYGSPFYPTHSFNPAVQLVDITDDFTSNADGASMGYLARIVYAWFSTKLACLGCAWWQGKDAFKPEFYVPVGVDGLKTWFRILMWLSVGSLAFSKKNRVTILCGVIFLLMNLAPLKYIGFGRYFMLMWLIPVLSMYNLVYNPVGWMGTTMRYGRFGVYALIAGLSLMVAVKTLGLYLRAIGLEGARQIVFREAAECGATFEADRPGRGFGIRERLTKVEGVGYQESDERCFVRKFDSFLYFPHGFSISPNEVYADYPKCDSAQDVLRFRFDKFMGNLPHILWAKEL